MDIFNVFEVLRKINVDEKTEKKETGKDSLTYLPWAVAWDEVRKQFPDATYHIWRDEKNRPYLFDEDLGYMVFTEVTIGSESHEMWLAVMDSNNRAMKNVPYEVKTKMGKTFVVNSATMTDINKTIMRCLVKNLAMFGLGLNIYKKETFLDDEDDEAVKPVAKKKEEPKEEPRLEKTDPLVDDRTLARNKMLKLGSELGYSPLDLAKIYGLTRDTTQERFEEITNALELEKAEKEMQA